MLQFGRRENLSPRIIRLYEIIKRMGLVTYKLKLPPKLEKIHDVFHVSMLHITHKSNSSKNKKTTELMTVVSENLLKSTWYKRSYL
ncbi:Chromo domain-containing protein [Gossypium australe]|uniref:Chromo domain-containing protein n=1 Tax=Gossypium australe TaxID=47621 RepID=A0A5B6WZN0_9ROSI|nr:Chromo domain-containing protein [Gossypium australe]